MTAATAIYLRGFLVEANYGLGDLIYLMARLRDPADGCPWDLAQTWASIVPSTLEEAYEVADSIERQNYPDLREELGDLLFQTVFYSRLAQEQGLFDLEMVISDLVAKLLRRHPHVFPDGTLTSRAADLSEFAAQPDIKAQWEKIKSEERRGKGRPSAMDDVPLSLPAITRAQKLQKRASVAGYDWRTADEVYDVIADEIRELQEAVCTSDKEHIREEIGDLLFSCINLSRKLGIDAEQALRMSNQKFENRFRKIEQVADINGYFISQASDEQRQDWWQAAKETL